jgi:hypothetical protein
LRRLRPFALAAIVLAVGSTLSLVAGMPAGGVGMPATKGDAAHLLLRPDLAGYGVKGAAAITGLSGTFVVPTLECPTSGTYEVGLSVQVVGGLSGGSFAQLGCTTGSASYSAIAAFAGTKATEIAVAPGNSITTDISLTSATGYTTVAETVTNGTTGVVVKKSERKKKALTDTAAWLIVQRINGTKGSPIPPFGTLRWSGASVNGASLLAAAPHRYDMQGTTKDVLVSTQAIGSTGGSFTNTFVASS